MNWKLLEEKLKLNYGFLLSFDEKKKPNFVQFIFFCPTRELPIGAYLTYTNGLIEMIVDVGKDEENFEKYFPNLIEDIKQSLLKTKVEKGVNSQRSIFVFFNDGEEIVAERTIRLELGF